MLKGKTMKDAAFIGALLVFGIPTGFIVRYAVKTSIEGHLNKLKGDKYEQ